MKFIKTYRIFLNESSVNNVHNIALEFLRDQIKNSPYEGKVYLAGGAVRDELMDLPIKDIDLLIELPKGGVEFAEWICKKLKIYKEGSNPVIFPKFGTAKFTLYKIVHKGVDLSEIDIECVEPRTETYIRGSRKPDIKSGTLKDDVDRRDFTVNSLLKDLSSNEILDLTGMGKDDIKKGIVRSAIDPNIIFLDDPLRMLRAIRFATKYSWKLPLFMIRSLKKNAKELENISAERITSELDKMLTTKKPDVAIRLLQLTNLSKYIFPELDEMIGLGQNKYHSKDAMGHTLDVLKGTPNSLVVRWSALLHDIGKTLTKSEDESGIHFYRHEEESEKLARKILTRLKYPNQLIDDVCQIVGEHMRIKSAGDDAKLSDKALRKLKFDLGDNLENTLDLMDADNKAHAPGQDMPNQIKIVRSRLEDLKKQSDITTVKLPINGQDIMDILGIEKGPKVGKFLAIIKDAWMENPDLTKEESIKIIKKEYENL